MPLHRQPMRAGQTRRACAHDRDTLVRRGCALKRMGVLRHQPVGGIALQASDFDRLALGDLAHADLFAQGFGRTDTGAHAAEDVLIEYRLCRCFGCARRDLANEQRDVDGGRTSRHAGRVMTKITPVRGDMRFVLIQRRMQIGKILRQLVFGQAACGDAIRSGRNVHRKLRL